MYVCRNAIVNSVSTCVNMRVYTVYTCSFCVRVCVNADFVQQRLMQAGAGDEDEDDDVNDDDNVWFLRPESDIVQYPWTGRQPRN